MKRILLIKLIVTLCWVLIIAGCVKETTLPKGDEEAKTGRPISHYEWLNDKGAGKYASRTCIIRVTATYQTDGTDSIIKVSLQHAHDILYESAPKDSLNYPYVGIFFGTNHDDAFVLVSTENISDTTGFRQWFLNAGNAYNPLNIKEDDNGTTLTRIKIVKP